MKHTFAIQVPINWNKISQSQQLRYHRMQKRDSRIFKKYLGIIKKEHDNLVTLSNRGKYQIDMGLLDRMTYLEQTKWKEASLSIRRQVLYYSSVAAGGYGDVGMVLVEHTRKVSFSNHKI